MVNDDVRRKVLGLVGLGVRARQVVVGVSQVKAAAQRDRVSLALVASDASVHSVAKVVPLLTARRVAVLRGVSAADLGSVTGREATAAIGVLDGNLASGIRAALGGDGLAV